MPEGTQRILNARALQTAHRHLAALLRPGLTLLRAVEGRRPVQVMNR